MSDKITPELPDDPGPDIQRLLDKTNPVEKLREETKTKLSVLPENLQIALLSFFSELAGNVVSQSTQPDGKITISENNQRFYEEKLKEVNESGLLNPHQFPVKKVT